MSEVIQPSAGQTVITTDHDHHRNHGGHDDGHGFRETRLDADFRSLTNEIERFGTVNGDRIRDTAAAGALAASTTDARVAGGFTGVGREICEASKDITGALGTGFTAAALAACKTSDEVAAVYASLQKQASDAATATVVGFKDAQATAYQIEGRTALDAAKNVAAIGLQATGNFNLLTVQGTQNTYQLSLEAVKFAGAAALTAATDRAAVLAAIEKCCCEASKERAAFAAALTATVVAGNTAILGKMDQTTIDNLRAQLVATQRLIPVTVAVGA